MSHTDSPVPCATMRATGAILLGVALMLGHTVAYPQTEPISNAGAFTVGPSGLIAFPTGRFREKDETSSPPKDGHKTGYTGGLEFGYFVSDFACVGLGYGYSHFALDLASGGGGRNGSTTIHSIQAWGRFFLPGGYRRWKPYFFAAAGLGRPKGTIDYDPPLAFAGLPAPVSRLESTVSMTSAISGGIGVLIPATNSIAFSFEPRYTSVGSKGTGRTDLFTLTDGSSAEVKEDPDGNRLKAKSNTNWWELRLGLIFFVR